MKISSFINDETLNSKFGDVLNQYDKDKNGLTRKEFSNAIKGMTSIFAKHLIKLTGYESKFFKELDKNEDKIISVEELSEYVKGEYELDFSTFYDMKVSQICDEMDKAKKNKNKE